MEKTSNLNEETQSSVDKLKEIEEKAKEFQALIDKAEMFSKLINTPEYKAIIDDGYLTEEPERIFGLLTTPTPLGREQIQTCNDMLGGIRFLKAYLGKILQDADIAYMHMEELDDMKREVLKSGGIVDVEPTDSAYEEN